MFWDRSGYNFCSFMPDFLIMRAFEDSDSFKWASSTRLEFKDKNGKVLIALEQL